MKTWKQSRAFTLVEMLVSMTILALVVVLVSQIIVWTTKSWSRGKQLADNLGKARAALDIVSHDLQQGIFRQDLGSFTDENGDPYATTGTPPDIFCFYTARSGGGNRPLCLVNYKLRSDQVLLREVLPVGWNNTSNNIQFGNTRIPAMTDMGAASSGTISTELAAGILAFRLYFIHTDLNGARSTGLFYLNTSTQWTTAVGITLVALDEQSQKILAAMNKTNLVDDIGFDYPVNLDEGLGAYWQGQVETFIQGSAVAGYPESVRTGIRVFETVVPLSTDHSL